MPTTLTATVTVSTPPPPVPPSAPVGTVQFYDSGGSPPGTTPIGSPVTLVDGVAVLTLPTPEPTFYQFKAGNLNSPTLPFTNVPGNTLLVYIDINNALAGTFGVSDTNHNHYTQLGTADYPTDLRWTSVFMAENIAGGSNSVTATYSQTPGGANIFLVEYAGSSGVPALVASASNVTIPHTPTISVSLTTTAPNQQAVLFYYSYTAGTWSVVMSPGTFTNRVNPPPYGTESASAWDQIIASPGTYTFTVTNGALASNIYETILWGMVLTAGNNFFPPGTHSLSAQYMPPTSPPSESYFAGSTSNTVVVVVP